ncbi:MAG: hypothetical protein Q4D66_04070 [Bacteroidales bacterium]|nr:hypothetical protein [Bacteroidales bacterium]
MPKITFFLSLFLFLTACQPSAKEQSERRQQDEAAALPLLATARVALAKKDFKTARITIKTLREEYPYALSARETAIVVMDSVDLVEAQEQLMRQDSLLRNCAGSCKLRQAKYDELVQRVKFYQRKIRHDQHPPLPHE